MVGWIRRSNQEYFDSFQSREKVAKKEEIPTEKLFARIGQLTLENERPYTNLKTYLEYKQRGIDVLKEHQDEINKLNEEETDLEEDDDTEQ